MSNDASSVSNDVRIAAQCTTVFCLLYTVTFVNVLVSKNSSRRKARMANLEADYDRYTSLDMRPADRLQANFLEWSPAFLGLVWSLALTGNLGDDTSSYAVLASWSYVALRALYMVLVLKHGVNTNGLNRQLWAATFPAYFCLTYLGIRAVRVLFF